MTRSGDMKHSAAVRCYTRQKTAKVDDDFLERPNTDDSLIVFKTGLYSPAEYVPFPTFIYLFISH